eukprot:gene35445-43704_t
MDTSQQLKDCQSSHKEDNCESEDSATDEEKFHNNVLELTSVDFQHHGYSPHSHCESKESWDDSEHHHGIYPIREEISTEHSQSARERRHHFKHQNADTDISTHDGDGDLDDVSDSSDSCDDHKVAVHTPPVASQQLDVLHPNDKLPSEPGSANDHNTVDHHSITSELLDEFVISEEESMESEEEAAEQSDSDAETSSGEDDEDENE